jgi:hypothetical protein
MGKISFIIIIILNIKSYGQQKNKKQISYFVSSSVGLQKYNNFGMNLEPISYYSEFKAKPQLYYSLGGGFSWKNLIETSLKFQHFLSTKISYSSLESNLNSLSIHLESKIKTPTYPLSSYIGGGGGLSFNTLDTIKNYANDKLQGQIKENTTTGFLWKVFTGISLKNNSDLTTTIQISYTTHGDLQSADTYEYTNLDQKTKLIHFTTKEYLSSISTSFSIKKDL